MAKSIFQNKDNKKSLRIAQGIAKRLMKKYPVGLCLDIANDICSAIEEESRSLKFIA